MWPPHTDAAHRACSGSRPSRSTRTRSMSAVVGVTSATCRQRDRRVTEMSSGSTDGAHSRNTVRDGGSSTTFSSAFAACSVSRSASSTMTICQRPVPGRRAAACTMSRIAPTARLSPSGTTWRTSAWVFAITVTHARHSPQPTFAASGAWHWRAAAKHCAATDRPLPGGPVNSHEWVIDARDHPASTAGISSSARNRSSDVPASSLAARARAARAAARRSSAMASCPVSRSKTFVTATP